MNNFDRSINTEIDDIIGQVVKATDPAILAYCKDYFEKNLLYLYGDKLEMILIVDAQAIISEAIAQVRKGRSFLLELLKSPFLKLYSPTWLRDEVKKKIQKIAEREGIAEGDLEKSADILLEKVKVVDPDDEVAYTRAWASIGYRDPQDIPYVTLYFSIKSHGILTRDKDIAEIPEIKTWERPGTVGKIISVFEKGTFSFLIVGKALPTAFRFLFEICVTLLKTIWNIVRIVVGAVYSLIKEGIAAISKLPDWVKVLISVGTIITLFWEKSRKIIMEGLQSFVSGLLTILNWFYQSMKNVISIIAQIVKISIEVLRVLFVKIEETMATFKQLSLEMVI